MTSKIKITKHFKDKMIVIWLLLITVLFSRTVYFGIENRSETQMFFFASVLLGVLFCSININKLKRNLIYVVPIVFLISANLFLNYFDMNRSQKNSVLGYILIALLAAVEAAYIKSDTFVTWYIRIIFAFCLISLPCVIIANVSPTIAYSFCQEGYKWPIRFGYSMFYTWGRNGVIDNRNSGPFWEPGAFQGFINIAILLLLLKKDNDNIKRRQTILTVFLITLLTTRSTTGYLLFALIAVFWNDEILSVYRFKQGKSKKIVALILCIIVLVAVFNSSTIQNKIGVGSNNISTEMRQDDLAVGLKMVLYGGPFGYGETDERNNVRSSYHLIKDDSNGLVQLTYTFGWIVGILYLFILYQWSKRVTLEKTKEKGLCCFLIMIILHMTEGLWSLPFYWLLILGV